MFVSLLIIAVYAVASMEIVENRIDSLISHGLLSDIYLKTDGWLYDYSTVYISFVCTVVFCVVYYILSIKYRKRNVLLLLISLYAVSAIINVIHFPQMTMIALIPAIIEIILAIIHFMILLTRMKHHDVQPV
jgi:hypothetical protein